MKTFISLAIAVVLLTACADQPQHEENRLTERYIEDQNPFIDLFRFRLDSNQWIRQSENIIIVHETFKKGFYDTFLTGELLDQTPFIYNGIYTTVSLRTRIDSLVLTYPDYKNASKYYREFWARRVAEHNDSTVFLVLDEVQTIINGNGVRIRSEHVNDQLNSMIQIVEDWQGDLDEIAAMSHFNFLRTSGFHQSAYNLLFESYIYDEVTLNRDSLKNTLKTESVGTDTVSLRNVFIQDTTP